MLKPEPQADPLEFAKAAVQVLNQQLCALAHPGDDFPPPDGLMPCQQCGVGVVEFTVPNALWNVVMRPHGEGSKQEYICIGCWYEHVAAHIIKLFRDHQALLNEVRAVIAYIPPLARVHVREGGGPEDDAATLAVSVAKLTHLLQEAGLRLVAGRTRFDVLFATELRAVLKAALEPPPELSAWHEHGPDDGTLDHAVRRVMELVDSLLPKALPDRHLFVERGGADGAD